MSRGVCTTCCCLPAMLRLLWRARCMDGRAQTCDGRDEEVFVLRRLFAPLMPRTGEEEQKHEVSPPCAKADGRKYAHLFYSEKRHTSMATSNPDLR